MTEAKTKVATEKKRAPVRHLTTAQKAEAIELWKSGTVTLDDLSSRFKKDRATFSRLFKTENIEKGATKEETERVVKAAVTASLTEDADAHARMVRNAKDSHMRILTALTNFGARILTTAQNEKLSPATFANDMKALDMAARFFKTVREEKYAILNIDESDANEDKPLPNLVVQELTAQDIKELHERSLMADDDLPLLDDMGDEDIIADAAGDDDENERVEVED